MNYVITKKLNFLVLLAALSQLITPVFATFDKTSTFNDPEIIPATYTFSIWGIITSLAFVYGIYQVLPYRKNEILHYRLGRSVLFVYILFSAWLFAADRQWLIVTVIIFVSMFVVLIMIFKDILNKKNDLTRFEKIILELQIALYTGWTTVAIFANTAACLKHYGAFASYSTTGIIIQTLILLAALANSVYFIVEFRFNYFYTAAILWAFIGVYFGLEEKNGSPVLKIVTVCAIAIILSLIFFGWKKQRQHNKFSKL